MKKILTLVLVALFVFSLSVSAMASETNYLEHPAVFDSLENYPDNIYMIVYVGKSSGTHYLYTGDAIASYHFSDDYQLFISKPVEYKLSGDSFTGRREVGATTFIDLTSEILWCNFDIYTDSSYTTIARPADTANSNYCNGSSCPATDADFDGICDDCGARLMNLVRTPVAPDVSGSNKNFVMFYTGETYYYTVYTSNTAYSIRGYNYGTRMRSTSDIVVNVQRFTSSDGLNWQSEYTGTAKDYYPGEQGWTLLSSTFNWYDSSENTTDPFFPVPLWAEVEKVTQGEIPVMTEQTMTTLGFLMVCGIGCLALLIVLSLFGKQSLIYRG